MLTILVYVCFFLGVFQLAKLPFSLYSALKSPKFGGGSGVGKRNNRNFGTVANGTTGNGNNFDNLSDDGNCNGMPDIND